jgi:hypothetical protein
VIASEAKQSSAGTGYCRINQSNRVGNPKVRAASHRSEVSTFFKSAAARVSRR